VTNLWRRCEPLVSGWDRSARAPPAGGLGEPIG